MVLSDIFAKISINNFEYKKKEEKYKYCSLQMIQLKMSRKKKKRKWAEFQENKPVVSRGNENPVDFWDIW